MPPPALDPVPLLELAVEDSEVRPMLAVSEAPSDAGRFIAPRSGALIGSTWGSLRPRRGSCKSINKVGTPITFTCIVLPT
eukprot:8744707-Alexandrium_andersonii.AAC.1